MTSQLFNALAQGFNAKQIIDHIIKKFPSQAKKLKEALSQGFSHDQILTNLTEHEKTRKSEISKREKREKIAGAAAMGGASLAGISLGSPYFSQVASNVVSNALPSSLRQIPGAIQNALRYHNGQQDQQSPVAPQNINPQQIQQPSSQQPPVANVQNNLQVPQTQAPKIPEPQQISQVNATQIIDSLKSGEKIKDLQNLGWQPDQMQAYFQKFHPDIVKKGEKDSGKEFKDLITQYLAENPSQEEKTAPPEGLEIAQQPVAQINEAPEEAPTKAEEVTEPEPIQKKSIVGTPQGVGEVREIRNGKAIVEIDGKLHKVDESDIEEPPLPPKELADLFDELISGIEEETGEDVSRHVTLIGYDPDLQQLIYKPWRGAVYTYNDVTDEELGDLKEKINRKTSGENIIGAYQEGTNSPIGAAMSDFQQRRIARQKELEEERKRIDKQQLRLFEEVEEKKKKPVHKGKFETIYYAYEPAEKAAEDRYKERKKQEREREKQAKKNARIS